MLTNERQVHTASVTYVGYAAALLRAGVGSAQPGGGVVADVAVSSSCWLRLWVPESGRRRRLHRLVAVPAVVAAMMMAVAVGVVR